MSRPELLEQLVVLTIALRQAQRDYFAASRSNSFRSDLLDRCRKLEREVDQLLAQIQAPPPAQRSLF